MIMREGALCLVLTGLTTIAAAQTTVVPETWMPTSPTAKAVTGRVLANRGEEAAWIGMADDDPAILAQHECCRSIASFSNRHASLRSDAHCSGVVAVSAIARYCRARSSSSAIGSSDRLGLDSTPVVISGM